jgi:hypothetical protein
MSICHCAAVVCDAGPDVAYAFLADPASLGTWALGCWEATPIDENSVRGHSLFDGEESIVRLYRAPEVGLVDFVVGAGADASPRISARVTAGTTVGAGEARCVVTLLAYRTADMSEERWARLEATHDVEIEFLRARIERSR